MLSRLWVKLTLAFVFVALVGVVLVAIFANRATSTGFQLYLQTDESGQLRNLRDELTVFYTQQGTWNGTNTVLRRSGIGPESSGGGLFLRVIDADNQVVGARGGQGRPGNEFDIELPIMVDGQQVGTLLAAAAGQGGRAGEQYLASVNQAIGMAGLAAIISALFLGILLAQRLTRPLRQLTAATHAVAAGNFSQQVQVTSNDEIGELAHDFNQMANALENSEQQRQQLLEDTAHDLRTPISVIRSHLEAMLDGIFPATAENLAVVHEETLRLSRLVDDVRTLSLVETGHLPLDLTLVETTDLVQHVVAAFVPLAEADGVKLLTDMSKTAPIEADPARLHQVLANLISNALRYAPLGKEDPDVVLVTVNNQDDAVNIAIKDNGPGLTTEQQQHVFDRFWRSDSARNRDEGGSGLGLAIARGIVEAHGGSITVSSEAGSGTTVIIALPKADPD